jgi:hypothetical protein
MFTLSGLNSNTPNYLTTGASVAQSRFELAIVTFQKLRPGDVFDKDELAEWVDRVKPVTRRSPTICSFRVLNNGSEPTSSVPTKTSLFVPGWMGSARRRIKCLYIRLGIPWRIFLLIKFVHVQFTRE